MKTQEVLNCQIQNWYPNFKKVTFKTKFLKLSQDFLDYLREDGVALPEAYAPAGDSSSDSSFSDDGEGKQKVKKVEEEEVKNQENTNEPPKKFIDLENAVAEAVKDFDFFFVKLNWSAPKDSDGWVPDLKCRTIVDVMYALKVSTFVQHDLNEWSDGCEDKQSAQETPIEYHLAMRKWYPLTFAMEFRCFVKDNTLIGISQRHTDVFYKFLMEDKETLIQSISSFFNDQIKGQFPNESFVFDVYIDIPPKRRVWLMDFNPWGTKTDGLLFEWEELNNMKTDAGITYRVIEKAEATQDLGLSQFKVPIELIADLENNLKFQDILNNKHPELFQNVKDN